MKLKEITPNKFWCAIAYSSGLYEIKEKDKVMLDIYTKIILELTIPGFREDNADHRILAELGMQCTEKVKKIIPTLDTQNVTPGKIGRLRGKVRKLLEEEIGEIDGVVEGLVG